jgi:hypothetical protein
MTQPRFETVCCSLVAENKKGGDRFSEDMTAARSLALGQREACPYR